MYIYIPIHMHMYICSYVHIEVHIHTYIYIYLCGCVGVWVCVCVCVCALLHRVGKERTLKRSLPSMQQKGAAGQRLVLGSTDTGLDRVETSLW